MSRYTLKDPRCTRCGKSLKGQKAVMIRSVEFYEQTDREAGKYTYGIDRDKVRYKFTSQSLAMCLECTPSR